MISKQTALITGWTTGVLLCLPLGIAFPMLWGVAVGSVLTAIVLSITVKLAVDSLVEQNIGQLNDQLNDAMQNDMGIDDLDESKFS